MCTCLFFTQGCNRFVCIFHIMAFHKDEQDTEHLSELIDTSFTSTIFTLKVDFLYQKMFMFFIVEFFLCLNWVS